MLNELAKTGLGKTVIGKEKLTVFSGHLGVPAWIRNKLPTLLRIGVHVFVEGISRNAPIKCMLGNILWLSLQFPAAKGVFYFKKLKTYESQ